MKLGITAFSSPTGLGHQTKELHDHMKPFKTLVIDLSKYNNMPVDHSWYPGARITDGFPTNEECEWLVGGVDAIFICETPLNYYLFKVARERGVKIIHQANPEFLDYFNHPEYPKPDIFALGSVWMMDQIRNLNTGAQVKFWPVPVNSDKLPFREITNCDTFIHIAGRPAYKDRNGTIQFLEAARRLPKHCKFIIYLQPPTDERAKEYFAPTRAAIETIKDEINLQMVVDTPNYVDMYKTGHVLVLPRKYAGLCLPMQEALSCGMPVIMTDISPNNTILPKEWLVAANHAGSFKFHASVDIYEADVNHLAEKMGKFLYPHLMKDANEKAKALGNFLSWNNLKGEYEKWISELL